VCGGNACLVHSTHSSCQDVVAQCCPCRQGGAPHALVGVRAAQGGPAVALHVGSIGGKHGEAEAVPEAGVDLAAFELEGSGERKSRQVDGGGAIGAAEELGPGALAILGAGGKVGLQGVCADLCGGLGERTLRLRDDTHGVRAGLACLGQPEANRGVVQGLPQRPERRAPSSHGKVGGGSSAEVRGIALCRSSVARLRPLWRRGRVSWSVRGPYGRDGR
jgi:hypothetical protein